MEQFRKLILLSEECWKKRLEKEGYELLLAEDGYQAGNECFLNSILT